MMGSHMPFHVAWHYGSLCVTGENRFLWEGRGVLHHCLSQPVCCKGQSCLPQPRPLPQCVAPRLRSVERSAPGWEEEKHFSVVVTRGWFGFIFFTFKVVVGLCSVPGARLLRQKELGSLNAVAACVNGINYFC